MATYREKTIKTTKTYYYACLVGLVVLLFLPPISNGDVLLWRYLSLLLAWNVHVLIHELGHAIAARRVGMTVYQVRVTGNTLYCKKGYEDLRYAARSYVMALKSQATAQDIATMIRGGPQGSLFALALGMVLAVSLHEIAPEVARGGLLLAGCAASALGLNRLLRDTSLISDSARLQSIARDPDSEVALHESALLALRLRKLRPAQYPDETLNQIRALKGGEQIYQVFKFWSVTDAHHIDEAETHIRSAFALAQVGEPSYYGQIACYEMAAYAGWHLKDKALCDVAVELGERVPYFNSHRDTAVACREYVWGNRDNGLKLLEGARQKALKLVAPQNTLMRQHVLDWFQRIAPELGPPQQ